MAHRVGVGLLTTGPLIGACWLAALTGGPGSPMVGLRPFDRVPALFTQIPMFPVVLLLIIPAAAVALAGAGAGRAARPAGHSHGRGGRPDRHRRMCRRGPDARHHRRTGGRRLVPTLLLAVAVSVLRLTLASTGFRRCARLRSAE